MRGLAIAPMFSSISPASTSSGRKYSCFSKRLPTMSMASRHSSSTRTGSSPRSSIVLARANASSSRISAIVSTNCFSSSIITHLAGKKTTPQNNSDQARVPCVLIANVTPDRSGVAFPGQARIAKNLRHQAFVPMRHDMHACDAFDPAQGENHLHADIGAFAFLIRLLLQPVQDVLGNVHARNVGTQPAGSARRGQRSHADEDVAAAVDSSGA